MSDLRDRLIAAGWKQGAILESGSLQQSGISVMHDAIGYLVLTQTCDCINPDFDKEPYLELLPLLPCLKNEGNPDPNYENGQNPREIHFWIAMQGQQKCVEARIRDIQLISRERIEEFKFTSQVDISGAVVDDIVEWRAGRYLRTTFPESFEMTFRVINKSFKKIVTKNEEFIDSLLISISPFGEIEEGEAYEIQLHLMVTPIIMGQPEIIESLRRTAEEIEELFATCAAFGSTKCSVRSLAQMTLWEGRSLLDFSRYDYLSFGKEDASPEN